MSQKPPQNTTTFRFKYQRVVGQEEVLAQKAFLDGFKRGIAATLHEIRLKQLPGFVALDPVRL